MPVVKHIYIPITKKYRAIKGLSERQIKKRLENEGWEVWRGGSLHVLRKDYLYPNVERKYKRLAKLIDPEAFKYLQYLSKVHHGMPDFLCYRHAFKFVECKLGHEQLSVVQKKCIRILLSKGFDVEIHKLVYGCTKDRIAYIDIENGVKTIKEKQMRMKLHWK